MTRQLGLVTAICLLQSSSGLTVPTSARPEALEHAMQVSADAWNRGDLDSFMDIYERSPNTAFVTAHGVVKGFDAIVQLYRKGYGRPGGLGKLTYSDLSSTPLSAGYAILYGRFHLLSPGASKEATGVFDLVMHKTAKGWQILSDHTS